MKVYVLLITCSGVCGIDSTCKVFDTKEKVISEIEKRYEEDCKNNDFDTSESYNEGTHAFSSFGDSEIRYDMEEKEIE